MSTVYCIPIGSSQGWDLLLVPLSMSPEFWAIHRYYCSLSQLSLDNSLVNSHISMSTKSEPHTTYLGGNSNYLKADQYIFAYVYIDFTMHGQGWP